MSGRRNRTTTAWVALLCLGAACSAESPARPVQVTAITINGASADGLPTLTRVDDVEPETPGVQVHVRLALESPSSTSGIWLQVGSRQLEGAVVADNGVEFRGVTIEPGENQLLAGCDQCQTIQMDITLYAPGIDIRDFVNRTITCLSHDEDSYAEGIQHEFLIRAAQIADGTVATVRVGDQEHTTVISDGSAYVQLTLPAESGQVGFSVETTADGEPITAESFFTIHCPRCELTHIGDATVESLRGDGAAIYLGLAHDGAADPGFQADLVVDSGGLPGTVIEIWADDQKITERVQSAAGDTRLPNVALEGSHWVHARCINQELPVTDGPALMVHVDTTTPNAIDDLQCSRDGSWVHCSWTSPEDPGNVDGVDAWEMRYVMDEELSALSYAEADLPASFPPVTAPGMPNEVMFLFADSPTAQISFAMQAWDSAGNASPISNVVVIP